MRSILLNSHSLLHRGQTDRAFNQRCEGVGGWLSFACIHRKIEEIKAVRMSYWKVWVGGLGRLDSPTPLLHKGHTDRAFNQRCGEVGGWVGGWVGGLDRGDRGGLNEVLEGRGGLGRGGGGGWNELLCAMGGWVGEMGGRGGWVGGWVGYLDAVEVKDVGAAAKGNGKAVFVVGGGVGL